MNLTHATMLRWPEGLREAVLASAARNRRSINAEILIRLEGSFLPGEVVQPSGDDREGAAA